MKKQLLIWTRQQSTQWNTEQLIVVSGSFRDRRINELKLNVFWAWWHLRWSWCGLRNHWNIVYIHVDYIASAQNLGLQKTIHYVLWVLKKSPLKIPSITSCLFLNNQDGQIGYKIDIEKYIIFFQFKKQTILVVSKRSWKNLINTSW